VSKGRALICPLKWPRPSNFEGRAWVNMFFTEDNAGSQYWEVWLAELFKQPLSKSIWDPTLIMESEKTQAL